MGIFDKKEIKQTQSSIEVQLKSQAKKFGIPLAELKKLGEGKSCPKYGTEELLHARRVKGGKLVVFNISEKHRGEKISAGRKNLKSKKTDETTKEKN